MAELGENLILPERFWISLTLGESMDSYLFSGLKVLDVATVIAAPAAAMILAEFGADVIKIESPEGDLLRRIEAISGLPEDKQDYMWQISFVLIYP